MRALSHMTHTHTYRTKPAATAAAQAAFHQRYVEYPIILMLLRRARRTLGASPPLDPHTCFFCSWVIHMMDEAGCWGTGPPWLPPLPPPLPGPPPPLFGRNKGCPTPPLD